METMTSIAAGEHQRDLRRSARQRQVTEPKTQVRRWVQLKHLYGGREERWGASKHLGSSSLRDADAACATC